MAITDDILYDAAIADGSYQIHRAQIGATSALQLTTDTTRDNWWPVRNPGDGRLYYAPPQSEPTTPHRQRFSR
jgi:hypothetical protein